MTDPQFPEPHPNVPPVPRAPENVEAPAAFAAPPAFGVPVPPPAPLTGIAPPVPQPETFGAPMPGAQPPAYAAPAGAYSVPQGGYTAPAQAYQPIRREPGPRAIGVLSFLLALIAAIATPILAGYAGFEIGLGVPSSASQIMANPESLAFLSPVREQVLWAEIAFWTGTGLGLVALILGIVAIARRRGRGFGIAGLVISVIAPVIFFTVLSVALTLGVSATYSTM